MSIVLALIACGVSFYFNYRIRKEEQEEYASYTKYDGDEKWVLKHAALIAVMAFLMVFYLLVDTGSRILGYLLAFIFAFMIGMVGSDLFCDAERYVYVKGNKIVAAMETLDRRQIKGYRKGKRFSRNKVVTFNNQEYSLSKGQMKALGKIAEDLRFSFKEIS